MRDITRVDESQLRLATAAMCNSLDMPGFIAGSYDVYTAILKEREHAITQKRPRPRLFLRRPSPPSTRS